MLDKYICPYFRPELHAHFIHPKSKTLFTFGCIQNCKIGTLSLETREMEYKNSNFPEYAYGSCPRSCYIESRNELHVIDGTEHHIFKYVEGNQLELISSKGTAQLAYDLLLYIPSQQILLAVRGDHDMLKIAIRVNQENG